MIYKTRGKSNNDESSLPVSFQSAMQFIMR